VVKRFAPGPDRLSAIAAKVHSRDCFRTNGLPTTPVTTSKASDLIEARFLSACAFCQIGQPLSAPTTAITPTSDSRRAEAAAVWKGSLSLG